LALYPAYYGRHGLSTLRIHHGTSISTRDDRDPPPALVGTDGIPLGLLASIRIEPNLATNHLNLAAQYEIQLRDFDRAHEALMLARKTVASSDVPNPSYIDTLAEALLLNGKADEALATETQAAGLDPDNPELKTRLAHFRDAADKSSHSNPVAAVTPQAPTTQPH
jgi:hypothetical protein